MLWMIYEENYGFYLISPKLSTPKSTEILSLFPNDHHYLLNIQAPMSLISPSFVVHFPNGNYTGMPVTLIIYMCLYICPFLMILLLKQEVADHSII